MAKETDHGERYNFQSYEVFTFTTVDQFHKKITSLCLSEFAMSNGSQVSLYTWVQCLYSHPFTCFLGNVFSRKSYCIGRFLFFGRYLDILSLTRLLVKRESDIKGKFREKFSPVIALKVNLDFLRLLFNSPSFSTFSSYHLSISIYLSIYRHTNMFVFG